MKRLLRPKKSTSDFGFNSLQTGKCIQSIDSLNTEITVGACFNSLQTGKCIQSSFYTRHRNGPRKVSIPFKRESVFRVNMWLTETCMRMFLFQFPSNGKVYSEVNVQISMCANCLMFQFPSNGKVYSEIAYGNDETVQKLRFNSLQTGKCIQSLTLWNTWKSKRKRFQFPSNGKVYSEIYFTCMIILI